VRLPRLSKSRTPLSHLARQSLCQTSILARQRAKESILYHLLSTANFTNFMQLATLDYTTTTRLDKSNPTSSSTNKFSSLSSSWFGRSYYYHTQSITAIAVGRSCSTTNRCTRATTHDRSHICCYFVVQTFHTRSSVSFSRSTSFDPLTDHNYFGRSFRSSSLIRSSYCNFTANHFKHTNLAANYFATTGCNLTIHSIKVVPRLVAKLATLQQLVKRKSFRFLLSSQDWLESLDIVRRQSN